MMGDRFERNERRPLAGWNVVVQIGILQRNEHPPKSFVAQNTARPEYKLPQKIVPQMPMPIIACTTLNATRSFFAFFKNAGANVEPTIKLSEIPV